jgi:hypothetical protein
MARRGKFNAHPVVADGIRFASKAEHARYCQLKLLERAKHIEALELQPTYALGVNGFHVCKYIADFRYREDGKLIVEDVKSKATLTPECKIKLKLMKGCHGIDVRLTGKGMPA